MSEYDKLKTKIWNLNSRQNTRNYNETTLKVTLKIFDINSQQFE